MPKKTGSKALIRRFLLEHIGEVVTAEQIRQASGGVSEWARRLRELREDENWPISSHNDHAKLRPGEYMLLSEPPARPRVSFSRVISGKLRAEVLDRNGFTCQMCGLTPGDIDPSTNRPVRLHIGHIVDKSLGGQETLTNLRALCSTCNQGAKNVTGVKPDSIWLLAQVRRSGIDEQKAVYDWLKRKFS